MTLKEKIRDVRALINEIYEDETNPERLASRDCFRRYCSEIEDGLDKLEKLEGIEKKLGIELTTLFEALEKGFFCMQYGEIVNINDRLTYLVWGDSGKWYIEFQRYGDCMEYLSDYGKTWALTKEELL